MMRIFRNVEALPSFKNAVLTIGTFDGVHSGHQKIIEQMKKVATKVHGETVIITFDPHPRTFLSHGKTHIPILSTLAEKEALLSKYGIDNLVIVPFNADFSNLSADDYIHEFLISKFNPHTIIIGYDHHFGKGRTGDYKLLEQEGENNQFKVEEISEQILNENIVSSTKIRNAILEGDISLSNTYLGHNYLFKGKVVDGNKLGRTIGFPTANIAIENEDKLIPCNGVYAVYVSVEGTSDIWKGMMNIGLRPTVGGTSRTIEINILDFNQDIYGKILDVEVVAFVRKEIKFNGLETLKAQLAKDKIAVNELLA